MNLDLGTLSGVLGVVLTVIFFLIGYRQTLGAKKERIRAANEIIIDTLLRRLILEPNFSIPAKEVEKFISGKALDARLTYSDVISGRELEAIIYSRIVDNDYVAADARKTILARVNECFRISEPLIESRVAQPRQADGQTWSEISLGVVAAFMSLVGGLVSYYFFRRSELLPSEPLIIPVIVLLIASFTTALIGVIYLRLRDRTQASTITPAERLSEGQRFEQSFAARLAEQGIRFLTLEQKEGADFLITGPSGDVAVELVSNVGRNAADTFWSKSRKMIDLCKNKGYKKGIIVSRNIVPARAARYTNEIVSIMTEQEFFTALPQEKRTSSG